MKVCSNEWRKLDRRAKNKYFKICRKKDRRERRAPFFVCLDCLTGFNAFQKCRIKECFCSKCGKKMYRGRGWICDTGTDADFGGYVDGHNCHALGCLHLINNGCPIYRRMTAEGGKND